MKRWRRRLLYLLFLLIWLLIMSFPVVAVVLATQDQIQLGSSPGRHLRLFLVQERREGGIGLEWGSAIDSATNCSESSLRYFMWQGEAENSNYCQCYDAQGALVSSNRGDCPAPP